jgi:uncharacterized membrane protein YqjE
MHRLLRLLVTQPQLLADHAEAYAELAAAELGEASAQWQRRTLLLGIGLCGLGIGVTLAGVALMLWATVPAAQVHAPWVLVAAPLLPAALGLGCLGAARSAGRPAAFAGVRRQWQADLAVLQETSAP